MGAAPPTTSDAISSSSAVDRVLQIEVLQSYIMQFLSVPSLAAFGLTSSKLYRVYDSELAWTDIRLRTCRVVPSTTQIHGVSPRELFHASFEASKGVVAYEERDFEAAIKCYNRALSIFRDVTFITRLADVMYATRDRQRAKALYEEAHAANPKNSYAVNGLALFARSQSEEERLLRLAVELDPMNSYALANLGGIIMCEAWDDLSRMRNQEAEDLLQRAVDLNPKLFYAPRMLQTVRAIQQLNSMDTFMRTVLPEVAELNIPQFP